MVSPLPVGDLSVRMRNDRREPNGAKTQRPERIPIDPEHRSYSRNATAAVAIDSLLQHGGRLEHDDATRRCRHPGGGLRIAADTLTFPDFSCQSPVSLQFGIPITGKCASRRRNASLVHASVYRSVVIHLHDLRVSLDRHRVVFCEEGQTFWCSCPVTSR